MATDTFLGILSNLLLKTIYELTELKKKKKEYYGTKLKSLSSKFVFVELRRYPCRETIS